ncbi:MAG: bifunctional oligoribonuclease/PAP phosphatase NrnA [Candidatus Latescibacterota bacterium]
MEASAGRGAEIPDLSAAHLFLRQGDAFLLTTHVNSDGDGIGACLAMGRLLAGMGKRATIVFPDEPDEHYDFLEGWAGIQRVTPETAAPVPRLVALDCPNLERLGRVQAHLGPQSLVLNVDHHSGNTLFGHVNVVTTAVSSTCEAVYHLAASLGLAVDAATAAQLCAGIVFDTGGFRYSLTTATTFEVAADLVRRGARVDLIAQRVFGDRSLSQVRQLGQALGSLHLRCRGRVAVMRLTHEEMQGGRADDAVSFGLQVHGVVVSLLLKEEEPGTQRVSLRSRDPFDVSEVAARFGGGGHVRASGCRLVGEAAEVEERLLAVIDECMRQGG